MQLTALVHSVEGDSFFTVIKDGRKVYFYLQKNLVKKLAKFLGGHGYIRENLSSIIIRRWDHAETIQ